MAINGGISAVSTDGKVENNHLTNNNVHVMDAFCPSSYVATSIDASTTPAGQVIALATGVKLGAGRLRVTSNTTGQIMLIGFGTDAATAVTNVASGVPVQHGTDLLKVPGLATHAAYQGSTGATTGAIVQGI